MLCPCGSQKEFSQCCEPFIKGEAQPSTAEQLMRARYSAYTIGAMTYIKDTFAPERRREFDLASSKEWSEKSTWKGLKVLGVKNGSEMDSKGTVEFVATYELSGHTIEHHEVAEFRKEPLDQRWYFVDGDSHTHEAGKGHEHHHKSQTPVVREAPKVGRNDACPCGSGKKYKKCCGTAA